MTLRNMRIFLEVTRQGSMSGAARRLYISQPTVSQAITDIERAYGVRLFDRMNKRLFITEAGRQLADYAHRIVELFTEMEHVLSLGQVQNIKLGATLTVGACIFSELVARYKKLRPEIETNVVVENTAEIEKRMLAGLLDFGLVEGRTSSPFLLVEPVLSDNMVLVAGPGHRFFGRESVAAAELHNEPFVLREEGSGTRELFEANMSELGVRVKEAWVCHSTDTIKIAVIAGHGLTVISGRLVEREIQKGQLWACLIEDYNDSRTFSLVYRKDKHIFPHFQDFIELCRKMKAQRLDEKTLAKL